MLTRPTPLTLDEMLKRNVYLPICPQVLVRLVEVLENPNKSVGDLAGTIISDPSLTAQVLRVSNSAFFGLSRQICSLEEAILRIGFKGVWTIAAALKTQELYQLSTTDWLGLHGTLWEHSTKTAAFAHALCKRLNPLFCDIYFTAGLLHDIGKLMLHQAEPQYGEVCQGGKLYGYDLVWREMDLYGTHHAKLGADLLKHWKLPELICDLVARHHEPAGDSDHLKLTRNLLRVANEMAHSSEPALAPGQIVFNTPLDPELLDSIGLDMEGCLAVGTEAQRVMRLLKMI